MKKLSKKEKRQHRHKRVRAKVFGITNRPRFSVFRSNKAMFVQIIDDAKGKTLASAHTREVKKGKPVDMAQELGKLITEKALKLKIKKVVFDRGGYKYHGRVRAVADGAREVGLKF